MASKLSRADTCRHIRKKCLECGALLEAGCPHKRFGCCTCGTICMPYMGASNDYARARKEMMSMLVDLNTITGKELVHCFARHFCDKYGQVNRKNRVDQTDATRNITLAAAQIVASIYIVDRMAVDFSADLTGLWMHSLTGTPEDLFRSITKLFSDEKIVRTHALIKPIVDSLEFNIDDETHKTAIYIYMGRIASGLRFKLGVGEGITRAFTSFVTRSCKFGDIVIVDTAPKCIWCNKTHR